jgi:hypothetical protein
LIAGQSNAVGCSAYTGLADAVGTTKFNEYSMGYSGIKIAYDNWTRNDDGSYTEQNFTKNGKFVSVLLGEGNSDAAFGMEIGIADKLSVSAHNKKVALIKYACGASSLLVDWAAPDRGAHSTFYYGLLDYVAQEFKILQDNGYAPTLKVMCWMQGEADSYPGYYDQYYDGLTFLVKDLRKDLASYGGGTDFAFVDAGISDSSSWVYYKEVNSAKKQFAATNPERNIYIDTLAAGLDKTTLQADNAHYQGKWMVQLGYLFEGALEPFLSPVSD